MRRGAGRSWPAVAAAAIVVTFAAQLALAAWNRGAETARLELTGASLALPSPGWTHEGEPLSLRIEAIDAFEPAGDELAPLGLPPAEIERPRDDGAVRLLDRTVWVVLDVSDRAWRRHLIDQSAEIDLLRQRQTDEKDRGELEWRLKRLEALRRGPPRALLVGAGDDGGELRRRFPDRTRQAVVRGTIRLTRPWDRPERREVEVRLTVDDLTVPPRFHGVVRELIEEWARRGDEDGVSTQDEPAFRALVAWGRRAEPWLVEIEPVAEEGSTPPAATARERRPR